MHEAAALERRSEPRLAVRREPLPRTRDRPSDVQRLLLDATGLKVVPLLQLFLADHNQLVVLQGNAG